MDIQIALDDLSQQGRFLSDVVQNLDQLMQKFDEKLSNLVPKKEQLAKQLHTHKCWEELQNRESVMTEAEYKIIQQDIELSISEIKQHTDFLEGEMSRLFKLKERLEQQDQECKHSEEGMKEKLASANHSLEAERRLFDMHMHLMQQSKESQLKEIKVSYIS